MSERFPLYPDLPEEAQEQMVERLEDYGFEIKRKIDGATNEVLNDFYSNLIDWIEGDAWENFRQTIVDGLCNYNNRKLQSKYDYDKIRRRIFEEYKDEIVADMNQDYLEENEKLTKKVSELLVERQNSRNRYWDSRKTA